MSIFNHFKNLELTSSQEIALKRIETFLWSDEKIFLLKGYAGSGKTTILKGLVEYLDSIERDYALMAPTGRAAKVISEKTGQEAFTIHKSIYSYEELVETEEGDSFFYNYKIRNNIDVAGKIFIVDESSMISDAKNESEFFRFGTGHLLTDLMTFTRISNIEANTKIIFVGDPCQLPPVGDNSSKAFDPLYLIQKFNVSAEETELKEIKRQDIESGITDTAGRIRKSISSGFYTDFRISPNSNDIFNPIWDGFLETWQNTSGTKIIIASKNKTCLDLNIQIRERRFGKANLPVQTGDIVIIGGNNYRKGIFNGEFAVVNRVSDTNITRYVGLKGREPVKLSWRDVELVFPDTESSNKIVAGKLLENFLYGDNFLRPEETQALYVDFTSRHKHLKPKTEEFKEAILNDDYFNGLLVKFGYAVTCHKAQGGEWDNVFTVWDHENQKGFNHFTDKQLRRSKDNEVFFRWAYTAVTRASKKLFTLNPPCFSSYSSMSFIDVAALKALDELSGKREMHEEITIDEQLLSQLKGLNIMDHPVFIQDHFIKVRHVVRKQYIELTGWEKKNLEIFYYFKRESASAALKTWINKENKFNGKFMKLPSHTNSEDLYNTIVALLNDMPDIYVIRDTVETIISKLEFEFEREERYPFTKNLFDDLHKLFPDSGIYISDLEHMQYKERYSFIRGEETAVIDFEYKDNGFFGRVVPVKIQTNSNRLIENIKTALLTLKQEYYAGQGN
jgi:hypothetical protein